MAQVDPDPEITGSFQQVGDLCFVYTSSNPQGRLGTQAFDLVYPPLGSRNERCPLHRP